MKNVLVDSSVWTEYFRGRKEAAALNVLIDKNQWCINHLILSELIRKHFELMSRYIKFDRF